MSRLIVISNRVSAITGGQSGRCLDANELGTANGTNVILWDCHGQSNQQWKSPEPPPSTPPTPPTGAGPCDIYASGGTPCIAAHSTARALKPMSVMVTPFASLTTHKGSNVLPISPSRWGWSSMNS